MSSPLENQQIEKFIRSCDLMLEKSYSNYSSFPVGAVIITECGQEFTGCNVENASYGLSICAERTAAVKAVSNGYRKFKYCFVKTRSPEYIAPCGACRQFLSEFGLDMTLYLVSSDRSYKKISLRELLPMAFTPSELETGVIKE